MEKLIKSISDSSTDDNITVKIVPSINMALKNWLLSSYEEKDKKFIDSLIVGHELSPFWPRIFGSIKKHLNMNSSECTKFVKPVLEALNIKGIIVGHTPQIKTNINSTCSNTVWRVDIASSKAFDEVMFIDVLDEEVSAVQKGRKPQVLEITLSKDLSSDVNNNLDKFKTLIGEY
jgi:hypothetical protein